MIEIFCYFKQKTAYEMRISDWSSDVCSSDLRGDADPQPRRLADPVVARNERRCLRAVGLLLRPRRRVPRIRGLDQGDRKSVVQGKSVSVRVDLGGRRRSKKKTNKQTPHNNREQHNQSYTV